VGAKKNVKTGKSSAQHRIMWW